MRLNKVCAALITGVLTVPALSDTTPLDFILIPVVASHARDAIGAYWSSTVSFVYDGSGPVEIYNEVNVPGVFLQPAARGTLVIDSDQEQNGHGVLVHGSADGIQHLFMQSHVYNEAHPDDGASIPCIRLSDITPNASVRLIGLPVGPDSRSLVRLYDLGFRATVDVKVALYDESGAAVATDVVRLVAPPLAPLQAFPAYPAYAEYRVSLGSTRSQVVSLEIEPITPGSLLWGFGTTTDMATDSVVAVYPAK